MREMYMRMFTAWCACSKYLETTQMPTNGQMVWLLVKQYRIGQVVKKKETELPSKVNLSMLEEKKANHRRRIQTTYFRVHKA